MRPGFAGSSWPVTAEQETARDTAGRRSYDPPVCSHGCCPEAVCAWAQDCAEHLVVSS